MISIRCFTCGSLIADKWKDYSQRVMNGENPKKVLDDLGLTRYCCRRMFITNVEMIDEVLKYFNETGNKLAQKNFHQG